MNIIEVNKDMILETSSFAREVFINYYNDLIGNEQATYMADLFLSSNAIEKLINEGAIFKLVKDNDSIIGFTEYKKEDTKVFLSKLYVHKDYRGKGIGKLMLSDCICYTKSVGLSKIYLTVNKGNTPSYNIYIHEGFKVIDAVVNDIGHGYVMDDYIMELNVN